MKIKFLDPAYAAFNGYFGSVHFTDGVSTGEVSDADARMFAAITSIEVVGDGEIVGDNERYTKSYEIAAVTINYPTLADLKASESGAVEPQLPVSEGAVVVSEAYTKEQLEAIADKDGIAGLREIADPLDVKGTSIVKLIDGIIAAQAKTPAAEPVATQE